MPHPDFYYDRLCRRMAAIRGRLQRDLTKMPCYYELRWFSAIMKRRYDIPAFARHLNALCEIERGPVLQKRGITRKFRFRFLNPLLEPYVIMRGISSGMLSDMLLDAFGN